MKEYLATGKIIWERRMTKLMAHAAKPLPVRKKRLQDFEKLHHKRERYISNVLTRAANGDACPQGQWTRFRMRGRDTHNTGNTQSDTQTNTDVAQWHHEWTKFHITQADTQTNTDVAQWHHKWTKFHMQTQEAWKKAGWWTK